LHGPFSLSELRDLVRSGTLARGCEVIEAAGRSPAQLDRAEGWQAVSVVLFAPKPANAPTPQRPDLEATCQRYLSATDLPQDGPISWLVLTTGQVLCVLACLAVPVVTVAQLSATAEVAKAHPSNPALGPLRLWIVTGGVLSFALSLALAFVFSRAKWVARLAEWQQAVAWKVQEISHREEQKQKAGPQ
jgi:hypothetical protein